MTFVSFIHFCYFHFNVNCVKQEILIIHILDIAMNRRTWKRNRQRVTNSLNVFREGGIKENLSMTFRESKEERERTFIRERG